MAAFCESFDAHAHNLQNIDLMIPLGMMVAITACLGLRKIHRRLRRAFQSVASARKLAAALKTFAERIEGDAQIVEAVVVDQSPIGRTPRSNPATYLKAFDAIRDIFAATPDAKRRGFAPGHFSFNIPGRPLRSSAKATAR